MCIYVRGGERNRKREREYRGMGEEREGLLNIKFFRVMINLDMCSVMF